MSAPLKTYLKTYRKRSGLTEDEVAFLIGATKGVIVSRHERLGRQPELPTVLAYELLYRAPARDLFAGIYQRVEREILARARVLIEQLNAARLDRTTAHKLTVLRSLDSAAQPAGFTPEK